MCCWITWNRYCCHLLKIAFRDTSRMLLVSWREGYEYPTTFASWGLFWQGPGIFARKGSSDMFCQCSNMHNIKYAEETASAVQSVASSLPEELFERHGDWRYSAKKAFLSPTRRNSVGRKWQQGLSFQRIRGRLQFSKVFKDYPNLLICSKAEGDFKSKPPRNENSANIIVLNTAALALCTKSSNVWCGKSTDVSRTLTHSWTLQQ